MAYNALAVANFFLDLAKSKGVGLDPMKLQKLIYFSHGWDLALFDKPLVDEEIQAWDYGPVIPSVYHEFKKFGASPITQYATDYDSAAQEVVVPRIPLQDESVKLLLKVWEIYGGYTGIQLSNLTHLADTAWSKARVRAQDMGLRSIAMDNEEIKQEFVAKKKPAQPAHAEA